VKNVLKWGLIGLFGSIIIFLLGPRVSPAVFDEKLPPVSGDPIQLEKDIDRSEARFALKTDNSARIVWADSTKKQKTTYSIVYIHGFGASWAEGEPVHRQLAKKYGCNLYLARLHDAGVRDQDAFEDLTPENFYAGAKEALSIAKTLGDSVVVIGCSAGGLLSLQLAAHHPELKGLVLYSPCVDIFESKLQMATGPWGKQILKAAAGEYSDITHYTPKRANYWLTRYHTNGLMTLQQTMDAVNRPENLVKIKVPVLMAYYYENEENQDKVVSVPAMLKAFDVLGTPARNKQKIALPKAGDHVIASYFTSKDLDGVFSVTDAFFKQTLHLTPRTF
jgi:pimeloyl-ACP methyl ester carboxylesterase